MAESFSVTRRFFDDKNYPRGLHATAITLFVKHKL
ncbi:Uncharacterised protein [Actinobacillus pleuropneumoniae]|nr:Uncharacterised protein [Actinobacillus pleuropneumoniae]